MELVLSDFRFYLLLLSSNIASDRH